jgi:hypothetical protein
MKTGSGLVEQTCKIAADLIGLELVIVGRNLITSVTPG